MKRKFLKYTIGLPVLIVYSIAYLIVAGVMFCVECALREENEVWLSKELFEEAIGWWK
jgi:hypothetical protein